jgi:hypothetical protein
MGGADLNNKGSGSIVYSLGLNERDTSTAKLEQFHWGAVVDDHCHPNTGGRGTRFGQDLLADKGGFEIVNLEGDVGDSLYELGYGAVRLETHPLDPIGTRFEAGHVHLELLEVSFARPGRIGGHTQMVVTPTVPGCGGRQLVVLPFRRRILP